MKSLKVIVASLLGVALFCLMGCAGEREAVSVQNVTDEMLTCNLELFSDSMGGKLLCDWRKLGGDGVKVSLIENGLPVSYWFTRETDGEGSLNRLEYAKTAIVELSSEMVLKVMISEAYDASSKRLGSRKIDYSVAERLTDADDSSAGLGPFSHVKEDRAVELMNEFGCSQLVEQVSTSPIEFFVDAYFKYDANTPYSSDDWGYYAGGRIDDDAEIADVVKVPVSPKQNARLP